MSHYNGYEKAIAHDCSPGVADKQGEYRDEKH